MDDFDKALSFVEDVCNDNGLEKPSVSFDGVYFYAVGWSSLIECHNGIGVDPVEASKDLELKYKKYKQQRVESIKKQLEELENE